MKKTFRFLSMAALALVGAMMTGCSSDEDFSNPQQPENKNNLVTLTTTVSLDGDDATRALTAEGVKTFAVGETMAIYYWKNKGNDHEKAVSAPLTADDITNGGKSATFTFTLDNPYKDMSVVYTYPAAMANANFTPNYDALYNNQDGTLATLASNFDFCTRSGAWSGDNLPTLTLVNQLAILAITLKNADGNSDITSSITGLTLSDGTYTYNVSRSAAAGPIYVAIRPTEDATITVTATDGSKNYTKTLTDKTYAASSGYNVSWRMTEAEVAGEYFTSKSDGTKVVFSPGNLQYQASTNTWRFAEHQYDVVGSANSNISSSYSGWIDLFGWGTSNKTFASGYGSATQPWSTITSGPSYGPTGTSNGLYGAFANGDWGVNMTGYTWRTLTGGDGGEWKYIFNSRASGATVNGNSNARYAKATINTDGTAVNGIILFPDGCKINSSSATTWGAINNTNNNYTTKCTTAQWSHLEELGCVFLPATGYRDGKAVTELGSYGYYWSSSPYASHASKAHIVYFYSGGVTPADNNWRDRGYSVRLVREVTE